MAARSENTSKQIDTISGVFTVVGSDVYLRSIQPEPAENLVLSAIPYRWKFEIELPTGINFSASSMD